MAFKLDGKTLPIDTAFSAGGINYPANWLRLTSLTEKKAIGITEVADEAAYDQRFYWSADKAKDLKGLQATWVKEQKAIAGSLLSSTDWYIVRKLEESTDIPATVSKYRDNVRTVCNSRETQINAVTDVTALQALVQSKFTSWPEPLS
jgi:hypothetical protein